MCKLCLRTRNSCALFLLLSSFSLTVFSPKLVLSQDSDVSKSIVEKEESGKKSTQVLLITPSRFEQDINKVGSSVSVISNDEIEARKDPNLLESFRNTEGLQVIQSGGIGRTTGIFLRGASPNQTLILVDGIPVNEANSGQFDFADISTLAVDRVEIIRGPQSVMYGSDAMGGVINIISSPIKEELKSSFGIEGGSLNSQRYHGKVSGGSENIRALASFSFFDTDNISVANSKNGNSEDDPYDNLNLASSVEADLPYEVDVKGTIRYTRARSSLDTFDFERGFVDALDFAQRRDSLQSSVNISRDFENWTPTLLLGVINDEFEGMDSEDEFNNYEFKSLTLNLQQQNHIRFTDMITGMAGYNYKRTDGENLGNFDERREVNSFFYEQQFEPFENSSLGAGLRHDIDSSFGEETTYRLFAAQIIPEIDSKLRSSFGTGFRAPTFNDLYFPDFSNENLSAETSRGFDVGITTNISSFETNFSYFETKFNDLISFNSETFMPENISSAKVKGFESRVTWKEYEWFEPSLTYTYLDSENRQTGGKLPRRARHQGGFQISSSPIDKLRIDTFATFLADREDSDGTSMDDYLIVNGSVRYEIMEGVEPYIRAINIFDKDYEEVPGFGTLGATVFAGVQFSL